MTLTGKQRSYLKGLANTLTPIVQVGKGGVTENIIRQVDDALEAREIVKGRVLKNCIEGVRDVADKLAERTGAQVVQVIGNNFVLFRPSKEKNIIKIP
jgi:RNA-binding protein